MKNNKYTLRVDKERQELSLICHERIIYIECRFISKGTSLIIVGGRK